MSRLASLLARYDGTLMRAPALPGAAAAPADNMADVTADALGQALLAWCLAPGAGLRAAMLSGHGARARAEALALHLDGSLRLQACGGPASRLALRLRVKLDDLALALGRAPRASDCWDSGWLIGGAAALARLAHWQPRRPTLLLADGDAGTAPPTLAATRPAPRQALRLLWVAEAAGPLRWQPLDATS